jgi:hypothetical protein
MVAAGRRTGAVANRRTDPLVDALFRSLSLPWVPWALSALIVGTALVVWRDFRFGRIGPVLRGLDDAIAAVEEAEGPGAFRRRFPAVFKRLAENPVVGEAWRGYAPTIAPAPGSEDALGYTRRPRESFGENLLALAGVDLRFFHAVPNLLVGAGLLFTFLGLVAALYFASRGVAAASVAEPQQALRELLAAATFKFVTSIAGLGSSLVFSWREKALLHRVHRRLAHFCGVLEARMVPVTAESIGLAQLGELRQQRQELQRLGRHLLVRVPETVEDRLAAELVAAVAPLRAATAAAASRLARVDEWVLDLVLDAAQPTGAAETHPAARALPVLERLDALAAAVRELRPGEVRDPGLALPVGERKPERPGTRVTCCGPRPRSRAGSTPAWARRCCGCATSWAGSLAGGGPGGPRSTRPRACCWRPRAASSRRRRRAAGWPGGWTRSPEMRRRG